MSTFDYPATFNARFVAWHQFLLPRLIQRVRQIVTGSEFTRGRILTHIDVDPSKITVIPCGVDSHFSPDAISQLDEATQSLKLPSRSYILTVGSTEPRKNLVRLFQAWAQAQARLPEDIWLVVAGARGNSRVFRGVGLDRLPARVLLVGHVDEGLLPSLYAGALAMVYVSIYEGFGLPPLEAMASGTPVVVGNCSSLPEVVGDAGILVDPFNVKEIAGGICRVVEDQLLRAALRHRGLVRAKQFSWDETARRTWDVLQASAATN